MTDQSSAVTQMIRELEAGDARAGDRLLEAVYEELRLLAAARLRHERPGHTLQATALVHEAYLRLLGDNSPQWSSKAHFFGAASEAMRRILVERARKRVAQKHGGGQATVPLDENQISTENESKNLLAIHEALTKFEQADPDKAALVKLRYFGGLSEEQAAAALNISRATASRHWAFARAWLYDEVLKLQGAIDGDT